MASFFLHDNTGNIVSSGSAPDDEVHLQPVPTGLTLKMGEAEPGDKMNLVSEEVIKQEVPVPQEIPEYVLNRFQAYPSIQEQLDMLYRGMKSGEIPSCGEFVTHIDAVKTTFPKTGPAGAAVVYSDKPIPETK